MAPHPSTAHAHLQLNALLQPRANYRPVVSKPTDPDGLILEAWAQGFMVGALIIMSCITVANMRRGVLLHKIILVEVPALSLLPPFLLVPPSSSLLHEFANADTTPFKLILGVFHGTFIFNHPPVYGWYLSVTAIGLNTSWSLHNVIAWMKNKPFLSRRVSLIYIGTVILVQPYWVLEIYANFAYFNNINGLFLKTRPFEALFRDPWWIFTTVSLFWNIKTRYELSILSILHLSPRFAIMLAAMVVSVIFIIVDILSVTGVFSATHLPTGINPWWKLAFVFKCLTDSVILDDFKTALDRLRAANLERMGSFIGDVGDPNSPDLVSRPARDKEMGMGWLENKAIVKNMDSPEALDFETALRESRMPATSSIPRPPTELQTHGLDRSTTLGGYSTGSRTQGSNYRSISEGSSHELQTHGFDKDSTLFEGSPNELQTHGLDRG